MKLSNLFPFALTPVLVFLVACSTEDVSSQSTSLPIAPDAFLESDRISRLITFESGDQTASLVRLTNAEGQIASKQVGVTHGTKALKIRLKAKKNYLAEFVLQPDQPWDWSAKKDFSLALDITTHEQHSTNFFVRTYDTSGQLNEHAVSVPAASSNTYYLQLKGLDLNTNSGIRANPPSWATAAKQITWRKGTKNLDLKGIEKIRFSVHGLLHDSEIIIDNIRLIDNPAYNTEYLTGLTDEFGQNARLDFPDKVSSLKDLKKRAKQERSRLKGKLMADRSKFGGWKKGPKLKGTGYFTTAKLGGKWSLVDPEGYLYFSTGIANVRMSNTSTMTGIDFDESKIQKRSADDVTPEDSKGLNRVSAEAEKERFVASGLRRNMFTWLPEYDDPLANHYGYRRSVHSGPLKKGETFSFYRANLERKYGETSAESFMDVWRKVAVDRMIDWGFTSFGSWLAPEFYQMNRMPYFANGWIIGDFKTVSSGADYWSPLPDPFDPLFAERARATAQVIADEVRGNPWCVGIFIDNEKSWGRMGTPEGQYGMVIHTLKRDGSESPSKAVFTRLMKDKYQNIAALNKQWNTEIVSWEAFNKGVAPTGYTQAQLKDYSLLLETYANEYFRIVDNELNKLMPNHMYLGARFADWGMTPEILRASAKYVDVMSYNFYKEGIHETHWSFLADIDMPSIIGEFHMGATDSGLFNPGAVHAASQADRAAMFTEYLHSVIDNPYFVGAHWFQYIDSPLTGRAYDGENYNIGFVSVTDTPYKELVAAAKAVNSTLYPRRFGSIPAEDLAQRAK